MATGGTVSQKQGTAVEPLNLQNWLAAHAGLQTGASGSHTITSLLEGAAEELTTTTPELLWP